LNNKEAVGRGHLAKYPTRCLGLDLGKSRVEQAGDEPQQARLRGGPETRPKRWAAVRGASWKSHKKRY